jgi:hypothetical protein
MPLSANSERAATVRGNSIAIHDPTHPLAELEPVFKMMKGSSKRVADPVFRVMKARLLRIM